MSSQKPSTFESPLPSSQRSSKRSSLTSQPQRPAPVTSEQVKAFWEAMQARYGTQTVDKPSAPEMRLLAYVLARMGVTDRETFLELESTTIGRRIYLPFTPGIATPQHSLWSQIVTCVREHQHVEQRDREGAWRFTARYLGDRAARALYKADAYTCELELHYWRTGALLKPRALAERLKGHGLRDADLNVAEAALIAAARTVRAGGVITSATKVALTWLRKHAPELGFKHTQGGET